MRAEFRSAPAKCKNQAGGSNSVQTWLATSTRCVTAKTSSASSTPISGMKRRGTGAGRSAKARVPMASSSRPPRPR